jgi:imidazolonepropionase-like amidohydrolase
VRTPASSSVCPAVPLFYPLIRIVPNLGVPMVTSVFNHRGERGERHALPSRAVGALHRTGMPIVAGTDQAVPGHNAHRKPELYVKAGMTPMKAIRSATIVPARAMNLDQAAGTIDAGKRADLILVADGPDRFISDMRKMKAVIAAGRAYDCAELWKSLGFRP